MEGTPFFSFYLAGFRDSRAPQAGLFSTEEPIPFKLCLICTQFKNNSYESSPSSLDHKKATPRHHIEASFGSSSYPFITQYHLNTSKNQISVKSLPFFCHFSFSSETETISYPSAFKYFNIGSTACALVS